MRRFSNSWVVPFLVLSSCSWIEVQPPPRHPPAHGKVDCTESRVDPAMDTVGAVLLGSVALSCGMAAVAARFSCGEGCPGPGPIPYSFAFACALPAAVLAIPVVISAEYGFRHTKRCREMRRRAPTSQPTLTEWLRAPQS